MAASGSSVKRGGSVRLLDYGVALQLYPHAVAISNLDTARDPSATMHRKVDYSRVLAVDKIDDLVP